MKKKAIALIISALTSQALYASSEDFVGRWQATKASGNQIEITKEGDGFVVQGRTAVVYVSKNEDIPKTYKAELTKNGALRVAFFIPEEFSINPKSGNLVSKKNEYRRLK